NIHITDSELIDIGPNVFDDNLNYGGHNIGGIFVGKSRNCHISGVGLSTPHGGDDVRGATIEAVDCTGLNITGCNIIDPEVRGIWLEDVRDSLVGHCVILHGERRFRAAVVEAGASDRNLIVGNRVDGGIEGAIVTVGAATRAEGNLTTA
ncbi:MAG TPA: right-handed parallel beta-helix repeat-containing protein, partial [Limnochordia bacterium]|nr:right-handed parallel beta-helix repeat-containing protein [Limnochordia bacterium]